MKISRKHKYSVGAKERRTVDGIVFASIKEANRYGELKLMQDYGEIAHLELQPKFPLEVCGTVVANYIADFRYVDCRGKNTIIEDVKGVRTPVYKLKKKLVEAIYDIRIKET